MRKFSLHMNVLRYFLNQGVVTGLVGGGQVFCVTEKGGVHIYVTSLMDDA